MCTLQPALCVAEPRSSSGVNIVDNFQLQGANDHSRIFKMHEIFFLSFGPPFTVFSHITLYIISELYERLQYLSRLGCNLIPQHQTEV